jgi:hypothetical protein
MPLFQSSLTLYHNKSEEKVYGAHPVFIIQKYSIYKGFPSVRNNHAPLSYIQKGRGKVVEQTEWIIAALDVELDPTIQLEISDVERESGIQRRECYRQ